MELKSLFIGFLILFTTAGFAQKMEQNILNDKDNIWIGETYIDMSLDLEELYDFKVKTNYAFETIKLLKTHEKDRPFRNDYSHRLMTNILEGIDNGMKVYEDASCKEVMNQGKVQQRLISIDTILSIDYQTFEEVSKIVKYQLSSEDLPYFKVRVLWYYNQKKHCFYAQPIAIAPIYVNREDFAEKELLFWVPVHTTKKIKINSPNISWAKRARVDCPLDSTLWTQLKEPVKLAEAWEEQIQYFEKNADKVKLYYYNINTPPIQAYSSEEIKNIGSFDEFETAIDTVNLTMGSVKINNKLSLNFITDFQFTGDWYWDTKKQQLYFKYLAFSPKRETNDSNGNFLNKIMIYYLFAKDF